MNSQVIYIAPAPSQPVYSPVVGNPPLTVNTSQIIVVPIPINIENKSIHEYKTPTNNKNNQNNNKYCNDYVRCLCCMCILCTDATKQCKDCICSAVNNPEICSNVSDCISLICGYGVKALCCCCEIIRSCK